jgi:hypothetical protein
MAKKENNERNHQAFEAWGRRRAEINSGIEYKNAQKMYRRAALTRRAEEGRLTDKNYVEMVTVGLHFKRS